MFTGIIEQIGTVKKVRKRGDSLVLNIGLKTPFDGLLVGESVAVNGACLTATLVLPGSFFAEAGAETLRSTSLKDVKPGDKVNIERAARPSTRLGGHIVQGHVDGVGVILKKSAAGDFSSLEIAFPPGLSRYFVKKGSVAVDGVSLTIADLSTRSMVISAIPHTLKNTTLGSKTAGDRVNLEADIIGKYVEKLNGKKTLAARRAVRPALY